MLFIYTCVCVCVCHCTWNMYIEGFENRVMEALYGPKVEQMTEGRRQWRDEKLHNLLRLVGKMGKARNSRGKTRYLFKLLVWTPRKQRMFVWPTCRWAGSTGSYITGKWRCGLNSYDVSWGPIVDFCDSSNRFLAFTLSPCMFLNSYLTPTHAQYILKTHFTNTI